MNKLQEKFLYFLLQNTSTAAQVDSFVEWIENGGGRKIGNLASTARHLIAGNIEEICRSHAIDNWVEAGRLSTGFNSNRMNHAMESDRLYQHVFKLLIKDAGFTKAEALMKLQEQLGVGDGPNNKISFRHSVARLFSMEGESKVLAAAQRIRNENVHSKKTVAWPLAEEDPNG